MPDSIAPASRLRVLLPEPGEFSLSEPDAPRRIDELYRVPARDWVRMNMLSTLNGRVTGPDKTSDSLSNRVDRTIMQRIRAMSDAVLVGARTVRQERHAAVDGAALVIVTLTGRLDGHRISEREAREHVHVLCPATARNAAARSMPGAQVHTAEPGADGSIPTTGMLDACRELGFRRIVAEGGRKLIGQLLDDDAIDEVCLTTAPRFGSPSADELPGSSLARHFERRLIAIDETGFLYARLQRPARAHDA